MRKHAGPCLVLLVQDGDVDRKRAHHVVRPHERGQLLGHKQAAQIGVVVDPAAHKRGEVGRAGGGATGSAHQVALSCG